VKKLERNYDLEKQRIPRSKCDSATWTIGASYAAQFESIVDLMSETISFIAKKVDAGYIYAALGKRDIKEQLDVAKRALRSGAEIRLFTADEALKAGCMDIADAQYRHVLVTYISDIMMSYRQRAQLGVDDVRVRKSSLLCRTIGYC
jgi:hypothetical protein